MQNNGLYWSRFLNEARALFKSDYQVRVVLLNEEQYRELCEACDRVLLAPDSTIERVCIPWLHVVREHPVLLANYADIFEPAKRIKAIARQCLQLLLYKAAWLRQLGRALRSDGQLWFGPQELPEKIDMLFVSHLLNASHAGQSDDFYFGDLPNELAQQGYSVVIALINYSEQPGAILADKWKENAVHRVVFSGSLGVSEEVNLIRRLKKESFRLSKLAKKETDSLFRKVIVRASKEALSNGSLTTLRMGKQIGALVAKLKPETIVVTHEGHAWERVAFSAARSAVPKVQCIGYQHAALFRLQHAIRRNLASRYNPDQILTAGIAAKAQLERVPSPEGIAISVLGSNRSFKGACASIHEHARRSDNPVCLVLPEGIASECNLLFEFSLACAQLLPEIQFIWRLHPIVSFESLTAQNSKLRNLPRNIVLSQATLEEDVARSRWALYRGTTAIISAVMAGVRPIYLQLPGEMTIDPLYELEMWRNKIVSASDFKQATHTDVDDYVGSLESALLQAQVYCESCYLPSDVGVLTALIPEKFNMDSTIGHNNI